MKKIGIDAKWYFDGPPSGRLVVQNLVDELIKHKDVIWYIFINKKHKKQNLFHSHQNVRVIWIWSGNNLISNSVVVPYYADYYNLDVVIYQNFNAVWGRHKKIAFIHDVIFDSHPHYYKLIERLYFSPLKLMNEYADLIVTVSESEKRRMIREGYPSPIKVVNNAVSTSFKGYSINTTIQTTELKDKYHLPEKFLFYVGRLNVRKNLKNLLLSLQHIKDNEIKLVIAGKQDGKTDVLDQWLIENNLHDRVIFTGFIPDEELPILMKMAHLFCFVSLEEGFGIPPIEAMSVGVPAIVSDIEIMHEVCGDAGIYIQPNNPKDIAEKILKFWNFSPEYEIKVKLGLLRSDEFRWEKSAKLLSDIAKDLS